MDQVTQSLLKEFVASQQIGASTEAEQFEHFVNYVVVSDLLPEEFDVESIATGAGEFGIDGVAVIVNDVLIEDEEQFHDLASSSPVISVRFVFTQAKSGQGFETGELSKFFLAAIDFFGNNMSFVQNERIQALHRVKQKIYEQSPKFLRGLPTLSLYFATTGSWVGDANLLAVRDVHLKSLREKHVFSTAEFYPADSSALQKLYFQTKNALRVSVNFPSNITLPPIGGVREAYIGVLNAAQYLKLITDEHSVVRRRLFFDNIRDFQGETNVNKSIADTIRSERRIEFPLRNNGITIVSRKIQRVGNDFQIEDFQIVNGCQTSHVIVNNWASEYENILIPIKLIVTEDEEVTRNIIIASNSQNDVSQDSFWALDPIHKRIEIFFAGKSGDASLFYERRPGQFNAVSNIEKVRVVTKDGLLKMFASSFLEEPNQVGRYYKDLLPRVGKDVFSSSHEVYCYYTSAFMAFRLEWLFRNRRLEAIYKPFRFQICMSARLIIEILEHLDGRRKMTKRYCATVDEAMIDLDKAQRIFEFAISAVQTAISRLGPEEGLDRRTAKLRDMRDELRKVIGSPDFRATIEAAWPPALTPSADDLNP